MRFAVEAAEKIAVGTGYAVIIRPHPTESVAWWQRETRQLDNVHVEPHGDLTPWLLAADAVLHNSCTSGIQAAASGVPVIAFGEEAADLAGECSVPNDVSVPAIGMEAVLNTIADLHGRWQKAEAARRALLARKLTGVGSLEPLQRSAEALLALSGQPNRDGNRELGGDSVMHDLKEIYRTSRWGAGTRRRILDQNKRPTIKARDIKHDVARLGRLLGHEQDIEVVRVGRNSYRLRNAP